MKLAKWILIFSLNSILFTNASWAITNCTITSGYSPLDYTMPLLKNMITIGRDVPVGTVLYRQTYRSPQITVDCDGPWTERKEFESTPLPKANWTSSPWPNAVYETGVPGIGVAIWSGGRVHPFTNTVSNANNSSIRYLLAGNIAFDIDFIKIGTVSPGIIRASNLLTSIFSVQDSSKTMRISRVRLSGDVTVLSQTCQTPDVLVSLGTNSVEPLVAGEQTETQRKNFSVILRDCPIFAGRTQIAAGSKPAWHPINGIISNGVVNNSIQISFTPKHGVLDSDAMIANLDPVQPGNFPRAQGIGIALYDPTNTRYKFDGHLVNVATPAIGSSADISIPLQAAYTFDASMPRTEIKPGNGSAAIEFTIVYL